MDVEKTIQFILDQMAGFAAGIEQLRGQQQEQQRQIDQLRSMIGILAQQQEVLIRHVDQVHTDIFELNRRMESHQAETRDAIRTLVDAQLRAD